MVEETRVPPVGESTDDKLSQNDTDEGSDGTSWYPKWLANKSDSDCGDFGNCIYTSILLLGMGAYTIAAFFSGYCCFIIIAAFVSSSLTGFVLNPFIRVVEGDVIEALAGCLSTIVNTFFVIFGISILWSVLSSSKRILIDLVWGTVKRARARIESQREYHGLALVLVLKGALLVVVLGLAALFLWMTFVLRNGAVALGLVVVLFFALEVGVLLVPSWILLVRILVDFCPNEDEDVQVEKGRELPEVIEAMKITRTLLGFTVQDDPEAVKELESGRDLSLMALGVFSENMYRARVSRPVFLTVVKWVVVGLNLLSIALDAAVYLRTEDRSSWFLTSVILRAVFVSLPCMFSPLALLRYVGMIRNTFLKVLSIVALVTAGLSLLAGVVAAPILKGYSVGFRVPALPVQNGTSWNGSLEFVPMSPICHESVRGLGLVDLAALSMTVYENETNFEEEMRMFFGPDWTSRIAVTRYETPDGVPFLEFDFNEANTSVFALRGFSSPIELSFQAQQIAESYAAPLLTEMFPLYGAIVDWFLTTPVRWAVRFGTEFFSPIAISEKMIEPLRAVSLEKEPERLIFAGINVGGSAAKGAAMESGAIGVGFWGLPWFTDDVKSDANISVQESGQVMTVFNFDGLWSRPEDGVGLNFGIPWAPAPSIFVRDSVGQSFCTLVEMCGQHERFLPLCSALLGDHLDAVREFLRGLGTPLGR